MTLQYFLLALSSFIIGILVICPIKTSARQKRIEDIVRQSEKGITEPDPHEDSYNLDHPIFNQNQTA